MGSLRVGHDWVTSLSLFTFMHWRRKWQPTPVFLPGESQGWGSLVGCLLWGPQSQTRLKRQQQQQQPVNLRTILLAVHLENWETMPTYAFVIEKKFERIRTKNFKTTRTLNAVSRTLDKSQCLCICDPIWEISIIKHKSGNYCCLTPKSYS